jgi:hypothetical protein
MKPILFVGGSGAVGSRATRALRRLHPAVPLLVGGRDLGKAETLANELGHARPVRLDLERPDLGLAASDRDVSAVVTLLRDERLATLDFAQAQRVPYLGFADFVFDVGPTVARYLAKPDASAILVLGQVLGGTVAHVTLHAARHFARVRGIAIGVILDENDSGGPAGQADFARLANAPRALVRIGGRFVYPDDQSLSRTIVDSGGVARVGKATPLLDVASLAAKTGAADVRVDLAIRSVSHEAPRPTSNETIIELRGTRPDGAATAVRVEMLDRDTFSGTSARGAAIAVERLLGLDRGSPEPLPPGLYSPEVIDDPARVVARLEAFGATIRELPNAG